MALAVLGTGLMGRGFALHLLASGPHVRVWNRRADKAIALEVSGAIAFEQAEQAVSGVERIHLSLAEYRASRHRHGIWQVEGGIPRPWNVRLSRQQRYGNLHLPP